MWPAGFEARLEKIGEILGGIRGCWAENFSFLQSNVERREERARERVACVSRGKGLRLPP